MRILVLLKSRRKEFVVTLLFLSILLSLTYAVEYESQNISPFYLHDAIIRSSDEAKLEPMSVSISGRVVNGGDHEIMENATGIFRETYSKYLTRKDLKFVPDRFEFSTTLSLSAEDYDQVNVIGVSKDLIAQLNQSYGGVITQYSTVFFTSNSSLVSAVNITEDISITAANTVEVPNGLFNVFPSSNVTDPIENMNSHEFLIIYLPLDILIENYFGEYIYRMNYRFTEDETVILINDRGARESLSVFNEFLGFNLQSLGSDAPNILISGEGYGIDTASVFTSLWSMVYNTLIIVQLIFLYSVFLVAKMAYQLNKKIERIAFQRGMGVTSQLLYFLMYVSAMIGGLYVIAKWLSVELTRELERTIPSVLGKTYPPSSDFNTLFVTYSSFYFLLSLLYFLVVRTGSQRMIKPTLVILGGGYSSFLIYRAISVVNPNSQLFFVVSFFSLMGIGLIILLVKMLINASIILLSKRKDNRHLKVVTRLTKTWNSRLNFRTVTMIGIFVLILSGLYMSLIVDVVTTQRNQSFFTSDLIIDYKGENVTEFTRFLRNQNDTKSLYTEVSYSLQSDFSITVPGIEYIKGINITEVNQFFSKSDLKSWGMDEWLGNLDNTSIVLSDDMKGIYEKGESVKILNSAGQLNYTLRSYAKAWFNSEPLQTTAIMEMGAFRSFFNYFNLTNSYSQISVLTISGDPSELIASLKVAFPNQFDYEGRLSNVSYDILSSILSGLLPLFLTIIGVIYLVTGLLQTYMDVALTKVRQTFALHQNVNSAGVRLFYITSYLSGIIAMFVGSVTSLVMSVKFLETVLEFRIRGNIFVLLQVETLLIYTLIFSIPFLVQLIYEYISLSRIDRSLVLRYAE